MLSNIIPKQNYFVIFWTFETDFFAGRLNVNELFLPTAKTRDAIYRLVKLIGYKPKPSTPAKVNITA